MYRHNSLISAMMSAAIMLGITGCGGSDDPQELPTPPLQVSMTATYNPSGGDIPVPNDILFGGVADLDPDKLTLNIPVADPTNYRDPMVAINGLDGWSAVAPFSISFQTWDTGLTLDPASVVGGTSVHVYKVNTYRPEVAPGVITPTGPVTSVDRELIAGLEYVVQATSGSSIAIIPTVPFTQQAGYMVVLTNDLKDSSGNAVTYDFQYGEAKSQTPISPSASLAALEPIRQLVNAMESAAEADGVTRSDIILSYQFTVQSVGTVMNTAKTAYIDYPLSLGATPVTSESG